MTDCSFEILHPGLLTTVQDMGRSGLAYYAIPSSGVMDKKAARIAQLLLHQDEDHALLECTSVAPRIRFHGDTHIALTGANFYWTLNNEPLPLNTVIKITAGDLLAGKMATDGLRGYLALNGILKLEKIYQSYSTYSNAKLGGYQGRRLQKGDRLKWELLPYDPFENAGIPIHPGPEFDFLTEAAKRQLQDIFYTVSNASNRMGLRLHGPALTSTNYQLEYSLPVLPGFVQLPPSGLPIIILQDGQLSGGYPRIAYLAKHYLSILNQVPLGGEVKLRLVTTTL